MRGNIPENCIELCNGRRTIADFQARCLAYMAATSPSVANSPRRAAASSASSSARSETVSLTAGLDNDRARSSISTARRSCWSDVIARAASMACSRRFVIWFMSITFAEDLTIDIPRSAVDAAWAERQSGGLMHDSNTVAEGIGLALRLGRSRARTLPMDAQRGTARQSGSAAQDADATPAKAHSFSTIGQAHTNSSVVALQPY